MLQRWTTVDTIIPSKLQSPARWNIHALASPSARTLLRPLAFSKFPLFAILYHLCTFWLVWLTIFCDLLLLSILTHHRIHSSLCSHLIDIFLWTLNRIKLKMTPLWLQGMDANRPSCGKFTTIGVLEILSTDFSFIKLFCSPLVILCVFVLVSCFPAITATDWPSLHFVSLVV